MTTSHAVAQPWRGIPPSITLESRPFWDAAREHRFLLLQCTECGAWYWPYSGCRFHANGPYLSNMEWRQASGRGTVFTFNVHYMTFNPAYPTPYVYAQVETEEGPLFGTNIVNCDPTTVRVGLPVRVVFDDVAPDITLPKFEPDPAASGQPEQKQT